jgi:hypothetical protein
MAPEKIAMSVSIPISIVGSVLLIALMIRNGWFKRPGGVRVEPIVNFADNLQSFSYLAFGIFVFGLMVHTVVTSTITAWSQDKWLIVATAACGVTVALAAVGYDAYRRQLSWLTRGLLLTWFLVSVITLGSRELPIWFR